MVIFYKMFCKPHNKQCRQVFPCMNCPLNNHSVSVFVSHKNVGDLLSKRTFPNNARFDAIFAKQLNFVQQIKVTKHPFNLAGLLYASESPFVQTQVAIIVKKDNKIYRCLVIYLSNCQQYSKILV